jgi:hypothetical protein
MGWEKKIDKLSTTTPSLCTMIVDNFISINFYKIKISIIAESVHNLCILELYYTNIFFRFVKYLLTNFYIISLITKKLNEITYITKAELKLKCSR